MTSRPPVAHESADRQETATRERAARVPEGPAAATYVGAPRSAVGLLALQRSIGNRAVARQLSGPVVQRHSVATETPEEDEQDEQSGEQVQTQVATTSVQRDTLRPGRPSAPVVQRGPIDWIKKKYEKWRNPKQGSYNIRKGEAFPTEEEQAAKTLPERFGGNLDQVTSKAKSQEIEVAWELLQNESEVERIWRGRVEQVELTKNGSAPSHDDMLDFRLAMGEILTTAGTLLEAQKQFLTGNKGKPNALAMSGLLNAFAQAVLGGSAERVRHDPELHPDREYLTPTLNSRDAAKNFLEKRQNVKLENAYVSTEDRAPFAAALKLLPTVEFLLKGGGAKGQSKKAAEGAPEWSDGGSMADTITIDDDAPKIFRWNAMRRLRAGRFAAKVGRVDTWLKGMMAPDFIERIPKPKVVVHTKPSPLFRANAGGGELRVAHNEATNVVAHEAGHVLEEKLPMKAWHDLHLLLTKRHEAAGGGGASSGENIVTKHSEGRFGGDYVTGEYTSTAYRSGNAEVVSMALQFFADPKDALQLIDGDPMHAAIVLRGFKPEEYKGNEALRPFDKYLPGEKVG